MIRFPSSKDPTAPVILTFDFTGMIPANVTLTSVLSVLVTTFAGTDSTPGAILNGTNGSPTIDATGKMVYVAVQSGADGCDYAIKVKAQSSNPLLAPVIDGILSVRS